MQMNELEALLCRHLRNVIATNPYATQHQWKFFSCQEERRHKDLKRELILFPISHIPRLTDNIFQIFLNKLHCSSKLLRNRLLHWILNKLMLFIAEEQDNQNNDRLLHRITSICMKLSLLIISSLTNYSIAQRQ